MGFLFMCCSFFFFYLHSECIQIEVYPWSADDAATDYCHEIRENEIDSSAKFKNFAAYEKRGNRSRNRHHGCVNSLLQFEILIT